MTDMEQRVNNALAELKAIFDQHIVDAEDATRALWIGDVQSYLAYTHAKLQRNRIERAIFALDDWLKADALAATTQNKGRSAAIESSVEAERLATEAARSVAGIASQTH